MTSRARGWRYVCALACCAMMAACGSQVPPKDFVGAQGGVGYNGAAGAGGTGATGAGGTGGTGAASGTAAGGATGGGALSGGTGGGGTTGGGSGSGTTGGSSAGSGSSAGGSATSGVRAGSCAGFRNTNGITNTTIPIANISDLNGPVPKLFQSAQAAVTAYVAYFNSTSSICGRKLKLTSLDSLTSESDDQQAQTTACNNAFADVGSMGAFDAGGASTAASCGIPDLRTASTETARYKSPVSFGAYSLAVPEIPTAPFNYFKTLGNGYRSAAFFYLNAGSASLNASSFIKGETQLGYDFKEQIAIAVGGTTDYNSYATRLKSEGIKYVQYVGAFQYAQKLKAAFAQQNYNPIFVLDPTAYDANFVAAGSAMNGTYVFIAGPLFEEAGRNPGLSTYLQWLQRTSGGPPSFFGTYAWTAAALFTQLAVQLGGKLSRSTLLSAIRNTNAYTNNGMVPPQYIGAKHTPKCLSVIQLQGGKWVRRTPYPFTCGTTVNSGVGG